MKQFSLLILSLFLVVSCAKQEPTEYEFVNLSEFNLDQNALQDGEPITIIYKGGGPTLEPFNDYFIQYLSYSKITGDTVSLLCNKNLLLDKKLVNRYKIIYLKEDFVTARMLNDTTKNKDISGINRVALPKQDGIERTMKYPAIIGYLGLEVDSGLPIVIN